MQVVTPALITAKKVILRIDMDVPIGQGKILEDFRLEAALPTLELCLKHAECTVLVGHIGRPEGKINPQFSVAPIHGWLEDQFGPDFLESGRLCLMENLRFESGEENCDPRFAQELASYGDFFVNEAFAAHHPASSTTEIPKLLPHAIGLRFAKEVEVLSQVRKNPLRPLVVIIGGVKIEDKLPAALEMSKVADAVLLGGKIVEKAKLMSLPKNIMPGKLNDSGTDLAPETVLSWEPMLRTAKQILWNGPMGKVEDRMNNQTDRMIQIILQSGAQTIVGGGDTIGYLGACGLLNKFSFVSTGGGAMLKFLAEGTLPTIQAL